MVRQMVGDSCAAHAWTGGNPDGGLGTDVGRHSSRRSIARWSEAGVVILVDLGGAETNSEMAIETARPGATRQRCSSAKRRSSRAR